MWATRIRNITDKLPQMNHNLFNNYYKDSLDKIPVLLEYLFKESVNVINTNVEEELNFKYITYREVGPEERVASLKNDKSSFEKSFSIRKTRRRVIAFMFEYMGEKYEMKVDIPYIYNRSILLEGNEYFPLFTIADKGGVYRKGNEVILQVLRTKLVFRREKITRFKTVEGEIFRESIISAKIHQGRKGRKKHPPIVLHHLTYNGFNKTMEMYGMKEAITLSKSVIEDKDYYHVGIRPDVYIRLKKDLLTTEVKRVVLGLIDIFMYYKDYKFEDLYERGHYIVVTGAWAQAGMKEKRDLYKHAMEFINMNKSLLDPVHKMEHNSVGIIYNNLDELLMYMFKNIDNLIVDYVKNSTNMLDKRIVGADLLMSLVIKNFNKCMFDILNSRNENKPKTIKRLMYHRKFNGAVTNSILFRVQSSLYNDNSLAAIGSRLLAVSKIDSVGSKKSSKDTVPQFLKLVHYSFPIVASIFTYPSSNPIIGGSLTPFVKVKENGDIITPEWVDDIKDVFGDN